MSKQADKLQEEDEEDEPLILNINVKQPDNEPANDDSTSVRMRYEQLSPTDQILESRSFMPDKNSLL